MSWDEPHFEFRIDPYLIRIMSTGRAPIGKYNLIHITDSSTNDYVTDLWKSEDTSRAGLIVVAQLNTANETNHWVSLVDIILST